MRIKHIGVVALTPLLAAISVFGQDPHNLTGFPLSGVFQGSEIDTVQLNNGNLHIEIPIWSTKGRGLDVGYKFIYDSKSWYYSLACDDYGNCVSFVMPDSNAIMRLVGPFSYSLEFQTQNGSCLIGTYYVYNYLKYSNFVLREPDGTKHHLVPEDLTYPNNPCQVAPLLGNPMYADDGSGWRLNVNPDTLEMVAVRKDGTSVNPVFGFTGSPVQVIQDKNGNQLVFSRSSAGLSATDTLGRAFPVDFGTPPNYSNMNYYDSSGTLRQLQVTTTNVTVQTSRCNFPDAYAVAQSCVETSGTGTVL